MSSFTICSLHRKIVTKFKNTIFLVLQVLQFFPINSTKKVPLDEARIHKQDRYMYTVLNYTTEQIFGEILHKYTKLQMRLKITTYYHSLLSLTVHLQQKILKKN